MSSLVSSNPSYSGSQGLPGLLPPANVYPNFVNPASQGKTYTSVATVLVVTMIVFVTIRQYTRLCIIRKLGWDDCTYKLARREAPMADSNEHSDLPYRRGKSGDQRSSYYTLVLHES